MTDLEPLHILALVAIAFSKADRESADPTEFGSLAPLIAKMKGSPGETLQGVLERHAGILWDGKSATLWTTILNEARRWAMYERAIAEMDDKIRKLGAAKMSLKYPDIAGRAGVDEAVDEVINA